MAERGDVDLTQFGEGERRGREREPAFEYESRPRSRSRPASTIPPWSNAIDGSSSTACQCVSAGTSGSMPSWTSPMYAVASSRPSDRGRLAVRPELFEVRDLADVDLRGEVSPDRRLERLAGIEEAAGEGPRTLERFAGALPEQDLERAVPHLQDDGQACMARSGKLTDSLQLRRQKLRGNEERRSMRRPSATASSAAWHSPSPPSRSPPGAAAATRQAVQRPTRPPPRRPTSSPEGRARRRCGRAERQRLQRARVQGAEARGA